MVVQVETKIPLHITKKKTNTNEDKYNYKETVKIRYLGGGGGDKDGLGEVVFVAIGRGCGHSWKKLYDCGWSQHCQ